MDQAIGPRRDSCVAKLNKTSAVSGSSALEGDLKGHSVAEIAELLKRDLVVVVGCGPIFEEGADCAMSREDAHPKLGHVPNPVRREHLERPVEVAAARSFH